MNSIKNLLRTSKIILCKKGDCRMNNHHLIEYFNLKNYYIIPPPIGGIAAGAGFSSFLSAITHSVVSNIPATEAAFCKAILVTLVGSITPAANRFSYLSVRAL